MGLAGRRLGGRLGLLSLGLGLRLDRILGVQLGLKRRHLSLQFLHLSRQAGAFGDRLLSSRLMVMVVHRRRCLRRRSKSQRQKCAESGPAEERGLAHHVSDPFLNIP